MDLNTSARIRRPLSGACHRRLDGLSRLADEDMLHVIDYVRVLAPTVPYL